MAKVLSMRGLSVDRYGEVCRLLAARRLAIDPLEKEKKIIEAEMRAWLDGAPADHIETVEGKIYGVTIGERRIERTVNIRAAVKRLGRKLFDANCSIPLGILDRLLPSRELQKGVITEERTGKRTIGDPVLLASPLPAERAAA